MRPTSAEIVATIDDLLISILLYLPVKSLMRFKSVSKAWFSLITNPVFCLQRFPDPKLAVALFLPRGSNSEFDYIRLNDENLIEPPPFRKLSFPENPLAVSIQQSCNGLLICSSYGYREFASRVHYHYVYNPTTKLFRKLPRPGIVKGVPRIIHGVSLAFDPFKSPYYKAICVRGSEYAAELFQIEIYSSESGIWLVSGEPFSASVNFDHGVYWNNAIHWISLGIDTSSSLNPGTDHQDVRDCLYFNVDEEKLGVVPMPPAPESQKRRHIKYFGESRDYLYLVESYMPQGLLNVYEMKRDYTEWCFRYKVDLAPVASAFPEMVQPLGIFGHFHAFNIFSLVRGAKEEDSFLIFQVAGKVIISHSLAFDTFRVVSEMGGANIRSSLKFNQPLSFVYIPSLCCI